MTDHLEPAELRQDKITLFDIRFTTPTFELSPNTRVTRYCLKLKKLPFHVEWIDLVDIIPLSQKLGLAASSLSPKGQLIHTLPAIYNPLVNFAISDSFEIALHLDSCHREMPQLFPEGTEVLCRAFITAFRPVLFALAPFMVPKTSKYVPERSRDYFERTWALWFGRPVEDMWPKDEAAVKAAWVGVKAAFDTANSWFISKGDKGVRFVMGGTSPTFTDCFIAGRLYWIRTGFGAESQEWKDIQSWNGARWGNLLEYFDEHYS